MFGEETKLSLFHDQFAMVCVFFFRSKIYENRYNDNKILLQSDEKKMETVATTNSHLKAPVASVNCRQKVSACAKNSSIAPNIMSCVFILQANAEKSMQGG